MKSITEEIIKKEFTLVDSLFGNLKNYHKEIEFIGHGKFCDVYFLCEEKPNQHQIDILNEFIENKTVKLSDIEKTIIKKLNLNDSNTIDKVKNSELYLDVISVPQNNPKYDLVVVCSKTYKTMLIFNKTISIRIEYKYGQIKTAQIKENTTEDND